jgi:hypothetical protein
MVTPKVFMSSFGAVSGLFASLFQGGHGFIVLQIDNVFVYVERESGPPPPPAVISLSVRVDVSGGCSLARNSVFCEEQKPSYVYLDIFLDCSDGPAIVHFPLADLPQTSSISKIHTDMQSCSVVTSQPDCLCELGITWNPNGIPKPTLNVTTKLKCGK